MLSSQDIDELRRANADLGRRVHDLENSTSWRVTAPMRWVSARGRSVVRRNSGGGDGAALAAVSSMPLSPPGPLAHAEASTCVAPILPPPPPTALPEPPAGLRLDLGCGGSKREGFIGLDCVALPDVDHVVDLVRERWPFDDNSVGYVYSSHFFEHVDQPNNVLSEIGRVCRDGARIEFWTPYAFTNEAYLYGHTTYLTEDLWLHFCVYHRDFHQSLLRGRWLLRNINYVVPEAVEQDLAQHGFELDFAIRYFKSVVAEFGAEMEYQSNPGTPIVNPTRTYSHARFARRWSLPPMG
jgi:SAM-dependent methyltransferase